ncbi:hypothetical protein J6T66_03720 [bacterium]|nr:hypothetical protein [bacterium]
MRLKEYKIFLSLILSNMYILITIDYIMYTQESWDKFYENYDGVLPWISVEHKRNSIKILTEVLGLNVE